MKKGTELALDVINGAGGIGGTKVEVIFKDDGLMPRTRRQRSSSWCSPTRCRSSWVQLKSITLSIGPKAQENKIVRSPALDCTEPEGLWQVLLSAIASDTAQGPESVKVAEALGRKEAAVMYINNDYGIGVKDTFVQAFKAAGGKVLIAQPFELGARDFRTEVLKVKETNPKVTFIVDHVAEGSIVIKQAKELGLDTQWVTDVSIGRQRGD